MKYMSSSTTAVSMVIAIVLFAVASWLDRGRPAPEPPPPEKTPTMLTDVRPDTEIRDELALRSCRDAENTLLSRLDASQNCEVDSDCTIFDYGYPIQCLTSVAQSEISALRLEYKNYEESCEHRVYYDCPSEPMERKAVCRENRCAVELQTLDFLKDETLRHLGIDPDAGPSPR